MPVVISLFRVVVGCGLLTACLIANGQHLVSAEEFQRREAETIQKVLDEIASKRKVDRYHVTAEDLAQDSRIKALGFDKPEMFSLLERAINLDPESLPISPKYRGYSLLDFNSNNPALKYGTQKISVTPGAGTTDLRSGFEKADLQVLHLRLTQTPSPVLPQKGTPPPPARPPTVRDLYFGPVARGFAEMQIKQAQNPGLKIDVLERYPARLYADRKGHLVIGIEGGFRFPHRLNTPQALIYYKESAATLSKLEAERQKSPRVRFPAPMLLRVATVVR